MRRTETGDSRSNVGFDGLPVSFLIGLRQFAFVKGTDTDDIVVGIQRHHASLSRTVCWKHLVQTHLSAVYAGEFRQYFLATFAFGHNADYFAGFRRNEFRLSRLLFRANRGGCHRFEYLGITVIIHCRTFFVPLFPVFAAESFFALFDIL